MALPSLFSLAAAASIPSVTLEGNVVLPMVALGTGSGQKGNVTDATMLWLLQAGGTAIDTAYIYGDQKDIQAGVAAAGVKRGDYFLETKIPCGTKSGAGKDIDTNLQSLGVSQVDLLLIHSPRCLGGSVADTWSALEDALAAGKTRAIGVSNFKQSDYTSLMQSATTRPVLVQNSFSVSYHEDDDVSFFKAQGLVYQAYSPLCGGGNGSSCRHGSVLENPVVIDIANSRNLSPAQIGLKFVVQQGVPLATAVWKESYMVEDLDLWSWGNLTADEMDRLSKA